MSNIIDDVVSCQEISEIIKKSLQHVALPDLLQGLSNNSIEDVVKIVDKAYGMLENAQDNAKGTMSIKEFMGVMYIILTFVAVGHGTSAIDILKGKNLDTSIAEIIVDLYNNVDMFGVYYTIFLLGYQAAMDKEKIGKEQRI